MGISGRPFGPILIIVFFLFSQAHCFNIHLAIRDGVCLNVLKKYIRDEQDLALLIEKRDLGGRTPLITAVLYGRSDWFAFLLEKGADINAQNGIGQTALHMAASWGRSDCLEKLINNGACLNLRDAYGNSPLHYAASVGNLWGVCCFARRGADINAYNCNRQTPLHISALSDELVCCEALVEKGASCELKNNNGDIPLIIALRQGNFILSQYLEYHVYQQRH